MHETANDSLTATSPEGASQMPAFNAYIKRSFELISHDPAKMGAMAKRVLMDSKLIDFSSQADLKRLKEISAKILEACQL